MPQDISLQNVYHAHRLIRPIARHTPLVPSAVLSDRTGAEVRLKLDFLQDSGAFKLRGATNRLLNLEDEQKRIGVITYSTGNHGLAVAQVAARLGIPAVICVSEHVAQGRVEQLRRTGAEVIVHGDSQDVAGEKANELVESRGLAMVPPFDDPHVIAGQGTLALELMQDFPELDTVLVQVSGGGLAAGVAFVLKRINPAIEVIGVSITRAPVMLRSIEAGKPVELKEEGSLAASLLGGIGLDNRYTFPMVRDYVDRIVLVDEDAIMRGMAFALRHHHFALEGAGAAGISALLGEQIVTRGKRVAAILTGSNVEWQTVHDIMQACPEG